MLQAQASRTATLAAMGRGLHRLRHAPPWILDDPYALSLAGPEWPKHLETVEAAFGAPVLETIMAGLTFRSRFTEDHLDPERFEQYAVLGAGLDSFAWRRPDLMRRITLVEVDHPATQQYKRARSAELALPDMGPRHVFAPVDFEVSTLAQGLDAAGFDWARPTFFSLLGVSMYLDRAAVEATLRTVARAASGSAFAFSYLLPPEYFDDLGHEFFATFSAMAAALDEPLLTFLSPDQAADLLRDCGLRPRSGADWLEAVERHSGGREDGLRPWSVERVMVADVA